MLEKRLVAIIKIGGFALVFWLAFGYVSLPIVIVASGEIFIILSLIFLAFAQSRHED